MGLKVKAILRKNSQIFKFRAKIQSKIMIRLQFHGKNLFEREKFELSTFFEFPAILLRQYLQKVREIHNEIIRIFREKN